MIHLNLDPTPVPAGEIVALTPEASITSLGEVRLPAKRRLQARRTVDAKWGNTHDYLLDARGNAYYVEPAPRRGEYLATSRNTGKPLTVNTIPARFRYVDDRLVLA